MTRERVTDPRLGIDEQSFTKGERTIEKLAVAGAAAQIARPERNRQ